jgi:hypothetical protein
MKHLVTMLFYLLSITLSAQENSFTENATTNENPTEEQLFNAEEQVQYRSLLNINNATFVDLLATGLLRNEEALDIIKHRTANGKYISIYELQMITSISIDTLMLLSKILYVPTFDTFNKQSFLKQGVHYSLVQWERKTQSSKGYQLNTKGMRPYEGDDYRLLYRFRSSISNLYYFGISLEKDAGEKLIWDPASKRYFFDFASAYLTVLPKKIVDQFTVGDFNYRNGHGLIFGGNFFQSKNPVYWQSTWQIGNGFRPHTSSSEYGYYRGAGIQIKKTNWSLSSFVSNVSSDGTIQADQSISSVNTSGLHRTALEIERRQNMHVFQAGSSLSFCSNANDILMSLEYLHTALDYPLNSTLNYYNSKEFRGRSHDVIGVDLQKHYSSGVVFLETAFSSHQGKALYCGMLHNLSKHTIWNMQAWSANATFKSFQGNIPSRSSNFSDETGMYQALSTQVFKKLNLAIGISVYIHPHARYLKKGPTNGSEFTSRLTYQLKKKTVAFIQFRKIQEEATNVSQKIIPQNRYYLMGDFLQREDLNWELHSRVQFGIFDFEQTEKSYCLTQSVGYKHYKLKIKAQVSVFNSPSWDSRLYSYETDVPMAFSIPALSGEGVRISSVLTVKPIPKTELSMKLSHTLYNDVKTMGSGNDEVQGNTQTELKLQARLFL